MKSFQLILRNLRQIDTLYNRKISKDLSEISTGHHFEVLLILSRQPNPITQNQLAELLQIDKSRMANIVFYLEQNELVTVKVNPADRRQHYVSLSANALNAIPYIENKVQQVNDVVQTGISEEKLKIFLDVSETIRQNLIKKVSNTEASH
jgi:DNA-binding MarR family transcriptional regulator